MSRLDIRHKFIYLGLVLFSSLTPGQTGAGPHANDPFSLNVRYARGPRAGQCMNLFDYRPAHLLTQEEAQQYAAKAELPPPEPGEIWIGNVWHRGKFYVVRVPALAVEDVLFQIERFDPNIPILDFINKRRWFAAHAQVRFKVGYLPGVKSPRWDRAGKSSRGRVSGTRS